MCGFAGYFSRTGECQESDLHAMGRAIAHRGPDDSNTWIDSTTRIGITHQRLAVIELSRSGAQPMVSVSGRYILAFNGEIYNHEKLRTLYLTDVRWRGRSDTETLLNLIEKLGIDNVPDKLTGMFAFAVWDQKKQKLHLVRDRFGEKPLYYGKQGNNFFFTSDLKALLQSNNFRQKIDRGALALYFRYLYVPAPYSIYEDIFKAPTASVVTLDTDTMSVSSYSFWKIDSEINSRIPEQSFDASVQHLDKLLLESVSGQLLADVPVGAFLSGGIDSSAVVSVMKEVSSKPVKTYCIGFDSIAHNEAPHARKIAKHLGTDHVEDIIGSNELVPLVQSMALAFDEPFADSSQIPTYAVAARARKETTVCLTGDGGDELFGGYSRYRRAEKIQQLRQLSGRSGRAIAKTTMNSRFIDCSINGISRAKKGNSSFARNLNQLARSLQLVSLDTDMDVYRDMASYWRYPWSPSLSNEPMSHATSNMAPRGEPARKTYQHIDLNNYLVDDILVKVDRSCMAVSLESRIPLLDHNLAGFIWSQPSHLSKNSNVNKPMLFELACKRIPRSLLERPKQGFTAPLHDWLHGPLKDWISELLRKEKLQQHGLLNIDTVNQLLTLHNNDDRSTAPLLWSIVMFQSWYESVHSSQSVRNQFK